MSKIAYLLKQIYLTLSNSPSELSLKRLGRVALFNTALAMTWHYYYKHYPTIDTQSLLMIVAPLFGYAGFNAVMNRQDKIDDSKEDVNVEQEQPEKKE